jgi:hypothetical protein
MAVALPTSCGRIGRTGCSLVSLTAGLSGKPPGLLDLEFVLMAESRTPSDRFTAGGLMDLRLGALVFVWIVRLPSAWNVVFAESSGVLAPKRRGRVRFSIRDNTELCCSFASLAVPCS